MIYKVKFEEYQGFIAVKLMTEQERFDFLKKNEFDKLGEIEDVNEQYDAIRKIIPTIKKYIKSVSINTDEFEIKSLNDLQYFQEYYTILFECINVIVSGPSLGKPKGVPSSNSVAESIGVLPE